MQILAAVAMVAVLVFIHEFGHFIVAKACRIHVPVFSLGFGRRVLGFKLGGTDYRLSLLPFGGYVKMAGANFNYTEDDDEDAPEDPASGFMHRPVWQRLLVVAAGPVSNLLLPVVVFTVLLMAGEPQPAAVVGEVERESPAARAGLLAGDRVVAVGGTEVATWGEMMELLYPEGEAPTRLTIEREGTRRELDLVREAGTAIGLGHSRPGLEVGIDDPRSPAGRAGVKTGDRVVAIEGVEVADWVDVQHALARRDSSVSLQVEDAEGVARVLELRIDPTWTATGADLGTADQDWGLLPATLFVGGVSETVDKAPDGAFSGCVPAQPSPPGPAALAGIQPGDRFLSVDGQPVLSWSDVIEGIARSMEGEGDQARARAVQLELVRQGKVLTVSLTPEVIEDTNSYGHFYFRPILGVTRMGDFVDGPTTRVYYSFPAAVARSGEETVTLMGFIVEQLGKLATGEAAMKRSLGGPVEIVRQASHAAEQGLFTYARLAGMLSISLGIVNLLPVPVLDGGQLLFFLVEAVRGRPLSHRLRERAQQIGVLVLVLLMLSVFIFDIQKLFEGGG